MSRLLSLSVLALALTALVGCGGGGSSVTTPDPNDTAERQNTVAMIGDLAGMDIAAESPLPTAMIDDHVTPGGKRPEIRDREKGLGITDDCAVVVGSPREGGSITYTDCMTPRGLLSGNVVWVAGENSWSSTRDLTFTRTAESSVFHLVGESAWTRTDNGDGTVTIHRTGESTGTSGAKRIENTSDLSFTRTLATKERSYPTGTQSTRVFVDDVLLHDVLLTFNGTSTVTALVDGETYTYNIGERDRPTPRHKPRPDRPRPGRR